MDPAKWRQKAKLSLREAARRLEVASPQTVQRYESGKREAPTSVALAYERESNGLVTAEDLNRVRKRYVEQQSSAA